MEKKILVLNSGSSSIKFQVLSMPSEKRMGKGLIERIGSEDAELHFNNGEVKTSRAVQAKDHREALQILVNALLDSKNGIIKNTSEIAAVGHRVVHGGNRYSETTRITAAVKAAIDELSRLAPLHNPHNLEGILQSEHSFPEAVQVAVFDTAFHQTLPEYARRYAIPKSLYKDHAIQVYGFHGTSHKFVSEQVAGLLPDNSKLITLHLGNGCSATAILGGKSIDHSLGFTPTGGLVMGTRSGDLDPGIALYLIRQFGYTSEEVERLIAQKSGLLGLTGFGDLRDVEQQAQAGDTDCKLALELTAYRIRKYIGAYTAAMNGLDGLVFTGGIGENSQLMRKMVCSNLEVFGIRLDKERNSNSVSGIHAIHTEDSKVKIWVVPTDEELEIARQTYQFL
jgi:acetate kinase